MTSIIPQKPERINKRHSGAQAAFARVMGFTSNMVNDLVRGRINVGPLRAREIEKETGSPMTIWLLGGDWSKRLPAIEAWHKRNLASAELSSVGAPPPE